MLSFIKHLKEQVQIAKDEYHTDIADALQTKLDSVILLLAETKNSVDVIVGLRDDFKVEPAVRLNAAKCILSACAMNGTELDDPMGSNHTVKIYLPEVKPLESDDKAEGKPDV